ncbi:calcium-binding protein [Aerophototrophica crusticola]|uniref:Calcium-binding protein n=1 Tax=Aerophototrophica crusticola TaxID=1709002 RepID=A0A858RAT2_9PROT|nr:calcium-binding protein [Rhodospirillaceae bacterium B3]
MGSWYGKAGNDVRDGSAYGDIMWGRGGDDILRGHGGADTLYGEAGNDRLEGGSGNDRLFGGDGDDILLGGDGDDRLSGGSGLNRLEGGNGNDTYVLPTLAYDPDVQTATRIVETAGGGIDTVEYNGGDEFFLADGLNVENITMRQAGWVRGDSLANEIRGSAAADLVEGGAGNDRLFGNAGADELYGGDGNDHLNGGAGSDLLFGGEGADTFWLFNAADSTGDAPDLVIDFDAAAGDRIGLGAFDGNAGLEGVQRLSFAGAGEVAAVGELRTFQDAQGTWLFGNTGGDTTPELVVLLAGSVTLSAGDFVYA